MLDIIGKRRYGYLLSTILVSLGLVFILATLIPNGNAGLQFSIDYTGGTVWEVHFEEGSPDVVDVRNVLEEQGLTGDAAITTDPDGLEYVRIRTDALLQETQLTEGSAAAALAAEQATAVPTAQPSSTAAVELAVPSADAVRSPLAATAGATAEPGSSPESDSSPVPAAAAGSDGGDVAGVPTEGKFGELAAALQARFGPIGKVLGETTVGPVVSQELIWQTLLLVLMAAGAIMVWVAYRFRDFRMGVTALTALLHDVIIVVGVFAVLGTVIGLQVDSLFVTAILTVIGYSVHDTIVVFDRIRENRQRHLGEPLEDIVNHSLVQTIGRSLTTSLTLIVTLVALMLFGGELIRPFTFALLVGVVAGTYSSLFVATPLFLDWHLWDDRRKAKQVSAGEARTSTA